jgi:hypothetical protein
LRDVGAAASQYVLVENISDKSDVTSAGCTPASLHKAEYGAIPLVEVDASLGNLLDAGYEEAVLHRIPARAGPVKLTQYQTECFEKSMEHIQKLKVHMEQLQDTPVDVDIHPVAYLCAFNALVHNSNSVGLFCNKVKQVALGGSVHISNVRNMTEDHDGKDVGCVLHMEIFVSV